jgi:hypothetical protein
MNSIIQKTTYVCTHVIIFAIHITYGIRDTKITVQENRLTSIISKSYWVISFHTIVTVEFSQILKVGSPARNNLKICTEIIFWASKLVCPFVLWSSNISPPFRSTAISYLMLAILSGCSLRCSLYLWVSIFHDAHFIDIIQVIYKKNLSYKYHMLAPRRPVLNHATSAKGLWPGPHV